MRFIACLVIALVCATAANAQDFFASEPTEVYKGNWSAFPHDYSTISGPAIEEGAFRAKYEEAQAEIQVKDRLIADLRSVIKTLESTRCPCCESGECQCGKAAAAKLVMVSMPGCPACEQWWTNERPRYEASGWGVERTQESPKQGVLYPYWRLCIGDECQVVAWCPFGQLDSKIESLLARRRNK